MTDTPICDFVRAYAASGAARLHMPGHKGVPLLGPEPFDITEIDGADALYEAHGIIRASERIAGTHFGAHTFFSAEGSSLCIRAMLAMAVSRAPAGARKGSTLRPPVVPRLGSCASGRVQSTLSLRRRANSRHHRRPR